MEIKFDNDETTRVWGAWRIASHEDTGEITASNGKRYSFDVARLFDLQAPRGERISYDVAFRANGRRLPERCLGSERDAVISAFRKRVRAYAGQF